MTSSTHSSQESRRPRTDRKEPYEDIRFTSWGRRLVRVQHALRVLVWNVTLRLARGGQRLFDLAGITIFLVICSPIWLPALILKRPLGLSLIRQPKIGRWSEVFDEYSVASSRPGVQRILAALRLQRFPVTINVLKGQMGIVGPRPMSPGTWSSSRRDVRARQEIRPGIFSLWSLWRQTSIDFGSELDADQQYVESQSVKKDLGILVRSSIASVYGKQVESPTDVVAILGVPIQSLSMTQALEWIGARLENPRPNGSLICFVNPHCVNVAQRDPAYKSVLRNSDLNLLDGIGMRIAGRILGRNTGQNVNGTDLFPRLCQLLSDSGKKLFLLGAEPAVVQGVVDWVRRNHPGVPLAGFHHGFFSPEEENGVVNRIRESKADVLLVAFGVPKQDVWTAAKLSQSGVKVAMGVGGLFDFYSGKTKRAPQWLRELGLEWVYRILQEPGRLWRRYLLGNIVFLARVFRQAAAEKLNKSR